MAATCVLRHGRTRWLAGLLAAAACAAPSAPIDKAGNPWERLAAALAQDAQREGIGALALAVVDADRVWWGGGGGGAFEDALRWRAGSVSKMFTDLAALQLVEEGRLDLDQPVTCWLPDFAPADPRAGAITLRQLMAHRAGLVREPPRGSYFDATAPTLAETVASLNATALVDAPGTRTKYSNAGIAVVGRVVEVVTGQPFATAIEQRVLLPMGMAASRFERVAGDRDRLARGELWAAHLAPFPAPDFPFGIAPAANLEAPLADLAEAARRFLRGGREQGGVPIAAESLAEMTRVQGDPAAKRGFGFGFWIDDWEGRRRLSHDGAVYGASTLMVLLPDEGLGVVVVAAKDCVHPWLERLASEALHLALAQRDGRRLPLLADRTNDPWPERSELRGRFTRVDGVGEVELFERLDALWLQEGARTVRIVRDAATATLRRDDPRRDFAPLEVVARTPLTIAIDGTRYVRDATPPPRPPPPPAELVPLLGEYGFDWSVLHVREEEGRLHATVEWFFADALEPKGEDRFPFPDHSLYQREELRFVRDAGGRVTGAWMAGIWFPRRGGETSDSAPFRIAPTGPLEALAAAARAAELPIALRTARHTSDLVDLAALGAGLRFDVRYATADNFLGTPVYPAARSFLQRPAAEALARAQRQLAAHGLGLIVHDGYRPWHVTRLFWDATPAEHHAMVADPAAGSRHNRGCAVDLSLCDATTGAVIAAPSGYDEFSPRANPWWPGGSSEQRWARAVLRRALEAEGFSVHPDEWWHFDFADWQEWPVQDLDFAAVDAAIAARGGG